MEKLIALAGIPAFNEDVRKKLDDYWIGSAQEFVSVCRASNAQYGSGLAALAAMLGLSQSEVQALFQAAHAVLPPGSSYDAPAELNLGTGAVFEGLPPAPSSFAPILELPPEKNLASALPTPVNQGNRNTCVAFTLAAMYQQMSGDASDLSEQFLYWACKERDGIRGDVGTRPDAALQALKERGICTEPTWPYNPNRDDSNPGHGPPPDAAVTEAQQRRITGFTMLNPKDFRALKAQVAQGKSVLIGLFIYEHWLSTWQSRTLGRVRKQLNGEAQRGGHAMCVVGYRDDAGVPGGGYFIVRNSWGADWGRDNPDGGGYAHIPYKVIAESNLVAFVIDSVMPDEHPQASATQTAPTTSATAGSVAGTPAGNVAELQALYVQAQGVLAETLLGMARLNELMARMGALLQGAPPPAPEPLPAAPDGQVTPAPEPAPAAPAVPATLGPEPPADAPAVAARAAVSGPLILIDREEDSDLEQKLRPNGLLATSGEPLLKIDPLAASNLARATDLTDAHEQDMRKLHQAKVNAVKVSKEGHYGMVFGNENQLDQAQWAIVVSADDTAELIKALSPLIVKRCRDQGLPEPKLDFSRAEETCGAWLARHVANLNAPMQSKIPVFIYKPTESCVGWLARHGTSQGPVEPEKGVPFYLMLVGRPGARTAGETAFIPFEFQYELDMFWGVGRLCFTDAATSAHDLKAYAAYAEQLVAFEQGSTPPPKKHMVYFGAQHELDPSTEQSAQGLVKPLFEGQTGVKALASLFNASQELYLGEQATRANLNRILCGGGEQGRPALLFTATHGIGFPADDKRLLAQQGALVCQDWTGFGSIKREHWYAAEDLTTQTQVNGLIMVCFACYGVGCPDSDQFVFKKGKPRPAIAPYPMVAQLPQQLLARGALAVLGHVDRAWTYSFSVDGTPPQTQGFRSVMGRLMAGDRIGRATDEFNKRQGSASSQLVNELEKIDFILANKPDAQIDPLNLSSLWVARNDARNYALLGDPAVRLPFGEG